MISQPDTRVRRLVLVAMTASGIGACASQADLPRVPERAQPARISAPPAAQAQRPGIGERAAAIALNQVGTPYRYGGSSPAGFDCSGLVYYSYARAGKAVPRTTTNLWRALEPVDAGHLRAGDLLFFRIAGKMSHVGIYVGGGRFVHAPSSGKTVSVERLGSEYYSRAFIRAGRPD